MKKIEKKLMEKKFEKLSGIDKIRYNLGNITSNQMSIFSSIGFLDLTIIGYLLMLPFIIRDGDFNRIVILAMGGILTVVFAVILVIVGTYKLEKSEKALEDFLNKKSKK